MAKKQGMVNLSIRLPVELVERVDEMTAPTSAAHDRVSRNRVIREAVREYTEKHRAKDADNALEGARRTRDMVKALSEKVDRWQAAVGVKSANG